MTASNVPSSYYKLLTSICLNAKFGHFSLYISCICLITVKEISMFVMCWYPSSYISSLSPTYLNSISLTWVPTPDVQNLKCGLNVLCNNILNATVPLIPIKWFFVPINKMRNERKEWVITFGNGLPSIQVFRTKPFYFKLIYYRLTRIKILNQLNNFLINSSISSPK